ncbi:MAG TPA: DUF494 family protein [Candidatus Saccharimonadaceae bacterium]|jgi:uncharacterized protein Smg (DUF494 family)|nr:DUF494 family protein [Candidatus Saccharimonadaceae bacterium]
MSHEPQDDAVVRLLRLFAERLESYLEGDELAFETLGERIEEGHYSGDDLQNALWALRSAGQDGPVAAESALDGAPGKHALRVLSAEERETVSPEAWGYVLDLTRRGALDSAQVERVLDLMLGAGVRPVSLEMARELASRVVLEGDATDRGDMSHGDFEVIH